MSSLIALVLEHYGGDMSRVKTYGWRGVKCPFHSDAHASGRVNQELDAFKCLACDASGDAIKLISQREGMTRQDAEQWANQEFGAEVTSVRQPAKRGKAKHRRSWRDSVLE
jgi:DNA primase